MKAQKVARLILTGGIGDGETKAESEVGRTYAASQGVSPSSIIVEMVSRTTLQNLQEAQGLMKQHGLQTCVIVTDPLHTFRSRRMAEDMGMSATMAPATPSAYQTWKSKFPMLLRELYFYNHYLVFGK